MITTNIRLVHALTQIPTPYHPNIRQTRFRLDVLARCVQWTAGAPSPNKEQPEREAGHSLPTTVQIQNLWISRPTSIFEHAYMA
jgi:hypothetical protein